MRSSRAARWMLGAFAATSVAACHHHASSDDTLPASTERIVHGVISVTGTSFSRQLMLNTGSTPLRLHPASSSDSAALTRLGGAEVSLHGVDDAGGGLRVTSFTAQRVSGKPVVDGWIRADGDRLYLETPGGRMPLGNPPSAFRQMIGARVWMDGPLDHGPNNYGVIIPH